MSWKGFQKAMVRLPQMVKVKTGNGNETVDPEFDALLADFARFESRVGRLHEEARKFHDAMTQILNHQSALGEVFRDMFQPIERVENVPSKVTDSVQQYLDAVTGMKQQLLADLAVAVDLRIVKPCQELISLLKLIRARITKRSHKLLDYDRHRDSLRKLQESKNRTPGDEHKMMKQEQVVEGALIEFNAVNDQLKTDLPQLMLIRQQFIEPCVESLYLFQWQFAQVLSETLQPLVPAPRGHASIVAEFETRRGDAADLTANLSILQYMKSPHASNENLEDSSTAATNNAPSSAPLAAAAAPIITPMVISAVSTNAAARPPANANAPPPVAGKPTQFRSSSFNNSNGGMAGAVSNNPFATATPSNNPFSGSSPQLATKPALPRPMSAAMPPANFVTALYDFAAQAEGDLSFRAGDRIEIVQRGQSQDEWWTGRLNGRVGIFPGNYVK